jgi:enediyne biosynthesis protein E4
LGAQVTLKQNGGTYQKEIRSGDSFISQSDLRIHFGLGKAEKAEKVVIRWPNGLVETLKGLEANRYYVVREGSGVDSKQTRNVNKMQITTPGG